MPVPSAPCPPGFRDHIFEFRFTAARSQEATWHWLMQPETFTRGQIWPWRVEFIDTPQPDGTLAKGFEVGTLNAHHGPLMNFCGVISRVETHETFCERDLEYGYGAYAIGFRLIRPRLLTIRVSRVDGSRCEVMVRVTSHVRRGWGQIWTLGQRGFWPSFKIALRRGVPRSGSA